MSNDLTFFFCNLFRAYPLVENIEGIPFVDPQRLRKPIVIRQEHRTPNLVG
jgi:hypothetical protein